jgi:hypothetical protein
MIIGYADLRTSYDSEVYAQRVDYDGNWGFPSPRIRAVRDIPGDQGGQVNLSWYASGYDPGLNQITYYSLWRAIEPEQAAVMLSGGAELFAGRGEVPLSSENRLIRKQYLAGSEYFWAMVGSQNAFCLDAYSLSAPTMFDSTAVSDEYHYFQVIAHTADPLTFFTSEPDSGYSVDNLAPCPPQGLAGCQRYIPEGLELKWDRSGEPDLDCYRIYRGLVESFEPGSENLIASSCDTLYFDGEWDWGAGYSYKLSAVDIHGNESGFALLGPDDITGDDTPPPPKESYLAQNYPNPFNPSTVIEFGLEENSRVSLSVFDTSGRLVMPLLSGERKAGNYLIRWDGMDRWGKMVSSGVYFCRLEAGDLCLTRKMIMLR